MTRKGEQFAGLTVAIVTPFKNGKVDEVALKQMVDWQIAQGTNGLCPVGTTGECPTLSTEEHERVIAIVCQHAAGRIKVMAGTGSNSTSEAIELTRFAKSVGADGAMKAFTSTTAPLPKPLTFRSFFTTFLGGRRKTWSPKSWLALPRFRPLWPLKKPQARWIRRHKRWP
jgi:hypothetical protein